MGTISELDDFADEVWNNENAVAHCFNCGKRIVITDTFLRVHDDVRLAVRCTRCSEAGFGLNDWEGN